MADEELLEELRMIARREGISLAEVIRQGMELRARQPKRKLSFIGVAATGRRGHKTAERSSEFKYEPISWR